MKHLKLISKICLKQKIHILLILSLILISSCSRNPEDKYSEIETIIATEDIDLLEDYLDQETNSDLCIQARKFLEEKKALLNGDLDSININKINKSNSRFERELCEIVLAVKASNTPNVLLDAKTLADAGYYFTLLSKLSQIQAIVDNQLLRHTMGELLYISSLNYKVPQSLWEIELLQQKLSKIEEKWDSEMIKYGSIDEGIGFGNIVIVNSIYTMCAHFRSVCFDIDQLEIEYAFRGGTFVDCLNAINNQGKLIAMYNTIVVERAKQLLDEYNDHNIKGRYAILKWLEYLILKAEFCATLNAGEIDVQLKEVVRKERNGFLKDKGLKICSWLN